VTSRDAVRNRETRSHELEDLAKAAQKSGEILGVSSLHMHRFPDNRMDGIELLEVVKCAEKYIHRHQPAVVYTHHGSDLNVDHQITNRAVVTACRPQPGQVVQTLLFFESPSSTEWFTPSNGLFFAPNWFVDISGTLERKLEALSVYSDEMRPWPHARSLEAVRHLAKWRGGTVGMQASEGFVLGRRLK
jgi:LmbE family N-acetylglucosaminyl deacetylase